MNWRKILNINSLMAITALFVSVLTLVIFIRQTDIMEQQSRNSVMPYLILEWNSVEPDTLISIHIENHGVGPAIITKRAFHYKGNTYEMDFRDFLTQNIPEMKEVRIVSSASLENGFSIPAGGKREIITVGGDFKSYELFNEIMIHLIEGGHFNYDIRYESIYGETWMIQAGQHKPIPLEE